MSNNIILAIDQGTSRTTVLAINDEIKVLGKASCEFNQYYPRIGWVEHSGIDIWNSVITATLKCLQNGHINVSNIAAIGIANQRETTCVFDQEGSPLYNFIVWQCRRSYEICEQLKNQSLDVLIKQKTGLILNPYFSGTKLKWLFKNINGLYRKAILGKALFGTIDTWLIYCLTGYKTFITDVTNASRTLMMNLITCKWDIELLKLLDIPTECLPKICSSSEFYGYTRGINFLPDGIPISGIAGDQQAALFGQACFDKGECKATYGTGSFILMNTGKSIVRSKNGLLTSVAIQIGSDIQYCLEGSAFTAGSIVQWLINNLGIIKNAREIENLASKVNDSQDVVFIPALSGLGAPYWKSKARGIISGIGQSTNKFHIARAVLEGICMLNCDIISSMKKDVKNIKNLKVDGGASANNLLMQIQADTLGVQCIRPKIIETTALGAAMLAGLAVGIIKNKNFIKQCYQINQIFIPIMSKKNKSKLHSKWAEIIAKI